MTSAAASSSSSSSSCPLLILHDNLVSSYSQKVRIALRERGIPFTRVEPPHLGLGIKGDQDTRFLEANPRLEVPALTVVNDDDDDHDVEREEQLETSIFDSTIILQYLEDRFPSQSLLPRSPAAKAKARLIEEVADTVLDSILWGLHEVQWAKRAQGEQAETMVRIAIGQLDDVYAWLEKQLGSREWFNGSSYGHADLCLVPFLARAIVCNVGPPSRSTLLPWYDRVMARPAVRETIDEMQPGLNVFAENAAQAWSQGSGNRREYRSDRLEWMIKSGGIDVVRKGLDEGTVRFGWPYVE